MSNIFNDNSSSSSSSSSGCVEFRRPRLPWNLNCEPNTIAIAAICGILFLWLGADFMYKFSAWIFHSIGWDSFLGQDGQPSMWGKFWHCLLAIFFFWIIVKVTIFFAPRGWCHMDRGCDNMRQNDCNDNKSSSSSGNKNC